jgi:hypothetical protein
MVSAAAMTYKIKRDSEEQQALVHRLQAQIKVEYDTIDLLKADWSLLTQPARLEKLTQIYQSQLGLAPVDAHQIVDIKDLPAKPPQQPLTIEALSTDGAGAKDKIVTGAVR